MVLEDLCSLVFLPVQITGGEFEQCGQFKSNQNGFFFQLEKNSATPEMNKFHILSKQISCKFVVKSKCLQCFHCYMMSEVGHLAVFLSHLTKNMP